MKTNAIPAGNDAALSGSTSPVPPQPAEGRLQQLCHGLLWILGRDAPQEPAAATLPNSQLQAEAGRILRPHLEAGLRELTEVLRDDLLVRIAYVQQLERLTEQEHEASSLSRLLQGPSPPSDAPSISPFALSSPQWGSEKEAPLSSPRPPELRFDWQFATLQTEQTLASDAALPSAISTTTTDAATPPATSSLPCSPPALLEADLRQAVELWRQGDEDRALTLCSRTLQHNPAAAPAYLVRGQMYEQRRQIEHALADFTSAIALCPQHPKAYLRRGLIRLRQKAWPEAIADAKAVIRLQPDCGNAYFLRASASFQGGDARTALADLNHLLQREPNNVPAYNERGLVLASLGEYPRALADYTRALRLKPRFVPARYNRGLALLRQGDVDLALAAFTEVIQLTPDHALAYYQRARIHRVRQDLAQATADCEQCLKLQPQFQEAEVYLHELQEAAAARKSERPSPPTRELAADKTEKKAVEPVKRKPALEGKSAKEPSVSRKDAAPSPREPANAPSGCITLTCEECGATCQVGLDRLDRKFQCRKCGGIYSVRPDGRLTRLVRPRSPREQFRASVWKAVRLSPLAALLLLVILAAWYGWRGFASARSGPAFPNELEPRAEILVKAWLSRDAGRIQRLTTPAQEDRIDAWLRANPFPLSAEDLKSSRTVIRQTKIDIQMLKEERSRVQLLIQVDNPLSSPIKLVQQWVRIGAAWYFQPFPDRTRMGWQSASPR